MGGLHDKLARLFSQEHFEAFSQSYAIQCVDVNNSFESSTLGGIKDVLTAAGRVIGEVSGGFRIDPGEIGSLLSDILVGLTETSSRDIKEEKSQTLGLVELH